MKYRIWDNQENCYFQPVYQAYKGEVSELSLLPDGSFSMRTAEGTIHESLFPDRYIIEPSVGRKDDSGQEIYVNDLVDFERFGNTYSGRVIFNDKTCGYEIRYSIIGGAYGEKVSQRINFSGLDKIKVVNNAKH